MKEVSPFLSRDKTTASGRVTLEGSAGPARFLHPEASESPEPGLPPLASARPMGGSEIGVHRPAVIPNRGTEGDPVGQDASDNLIEHQGTRIVPPTPRPRRGLPIRALPRSAGLLKATGSARGCLLLFFQAS